MTRSSILLAWALSATLFFVGFMLRVSPSVMVDELMRDFAVSAAVLGNLSAFYFYSYASLQIPVGLMMDRFGPRRLLTVSAFVCALGCVMFAGAGSIELAYLGRALIGIGAAFAFVGTLTITVQWFPPAQFALMAGMLQFFGMAGAIGGQAPVALMVGAAGWRTTMWVFAAVLLAVSALLWLVVRDRGAKRVSADLLRGLGVVMRNPQSWLCTLIALSMAGSMLAFAGLWGVPFLDVAYGLDRAAAAATLSTFYIGWGLASPLLGRASDRLGRRKPFLVAGTLGIAICMFIVVQAPPAPAWVLGLLFFVTGSLGSLMILTYASAKELNPPGASGVAMGLVNMAAVGSGALFQPLIGILLDLNWQGESAGGVRIYSLQAFRSSLWILPAAAAGGFALSLFLRESGRVEAGDR